MPTLIPAAAAYWAGGAAAAAGWSAVAVAVTQFAVAAVTSQLVAKAFEKRGFGAEQRGSQVVLRSAVEAQRIIYGETLVSGPLVYSRVSRDTALASERHRIPVAAPFTITAEYAAEYQSTLQVQQVTGENTGEGYLETVFLLTPTGGAPGADEYSVSAGVYTFNAARAGQEVNLLYYHGGDEQQNSWLHLVIPLAYHEVEAIGDVYFNADVIASGDLDGEGNVVSGRYAGHAVIRKHLGGSGQTADGYLVARSNGQWTSEHVGEGVAYIIVSLRRNPNIYTAGVPNIRAKVKGAKLYDPRSMSTAWSSNWALVVRDYLTRAEGLGCASSEIDDDLVSAAANVADEQVALDAVPNYQDRYTVDGVVSTDGRPIDVLRQLLGAGAGVAVYSVSTWNLYAGAYVAPTRTITVSDLRDSISGAPDLPRRDAFNAVRGTFVNPDADWQATSFPPVVNSTYQTEDGGEQIFRDIELPFTKDAIRAQRLAKIVLERARQGGTLGWPGKLTCFRLNTWETVNVEVAQLGFSPKVFRVNGWQWQPGGGVDLALQEESSAAYDWNFGEQTEHDPAPNSTLPTGPLAPPGAPVVTEELYESRDGRGVAAVANLAWAPSSDSYAEIYEPEYKLASDAQWTRLPPTADTSAQVVDIAPGIYDFRVRARDGIGRTSGYGQTRQEIGGLGTPPATPTGVSLQIAGGTAILTLDQHPDLDVLRGGRIMVRHTEATSSQVWEESFSIGNQETYPGDSVVIFLPLKAGSYLVKARDSIGQESSGFAAVVTKQASVLAFTQLATPLQEDSTFSGTHSDTVASGGALLLDDSGGSVEPSGTYTFGAGFDFGSVSLARVTGQVEGFVFNNDDLIDSRTDPIDSWFDIDGSSGFGSSGDVWLETRETDDDPAGSPTWSAWKRIDAGEFACRGMQFRLQMRSYDPIYQVQVDILRVKAEEIV